jgi:hypothetical protein
MVARATGREDAEPQASPFSAGSVPGCAVQTGQTSVLGGAPKRDSQRQNILVRGQLHVAPRGR